MTLLAALRSIAPSLHGARGFRGRLADRGRIGKETEGLVGCFVNTLALRANLAGNLTFRQLWRR